MTLLLQVLLAAALVVVMIALRLVADRRVARHRGGLGGGCMRVDCVTDCDNGRGDNRVGDSKAPPADRPTESDLNRSV